MPSRARWRRSSPSITGKQLVIDNKGGAGGTVGASVAATAAPSDGYTLFMGAVHHTIAPVDVPQARLRPRAGLRAADAGWPRCRRWWS